MDESFPFYYAPGSFPSQNFRHFDHTLAGPILDKAGPSGILLNRSERSPESVVSESDSPTSSRSAEGLARKEKKTILQMAARRAKGSSNENQTMIRLSEEWSTCKAQHEFYVNAAVSIEKRLQNWHVFIHPSLIQDEKTNICSCCMSIICRSRRAKANQNARFGFMFITAQYAPEMKSDQLCLC